MCKFFFKLLSMLSLQCLFYNQKSVRLLHRICTHPHIPVRMCNYSNVPGKFPTDYPLQHILSIKCKNANPGIHCKEKNLRGYLLFFISLALCVDHIHYQNTQRGHMSFMMSFVLKSMLSLWD